MKILQWQRFFAEQKAAHGKVVFSVAELANAARTTPHAVNTEIGRLLHRGVIARYAQGRYGPAEAASGAAALPGGGAHGRCGKAIHTAGELIESCPTTFYNQMQRSTKRT